MTNEKRFRSSKGLLTWAMLAFSLPLRLAAFPAEVLPDTEAAWEGSVHSLLEQVKHDRGLPIASGVHELKRASHHFGNGLPDPIVRGDIQPVPSGLIHYWVGTALISSGQLSDVLSVLQDYESYKDIYRPAVVESKLISRGPDTFKYRVKFVQKGLGVKAGLIGEFCTRYYRTGLEGGYSVTEATRLTEIQNPGEPEEKILDGNRSFGYVQRSFTIVRYQQTDADTLVQVETLTLSRGVHASVRWLVMPLIRHFSQQTMATMLERLQSSILANRDGAVASAR